MQRAGRGLPVWVRLMPRLKGCIAGRAAGRDSVQAEWDLRRIQARLKGEEAARVCNRP